MKTKDIKRISRQRKEEDKIKAKMSESDRRAADKMEEMYKLYFGPVANARMSEDENALAFALIDLGAKAVEWLDIITKDIEDNMKIEIVEAPEEK